MTDWREKVARIINPEKWRVLDSYLADVKRKYRGENASYDLDAFKDKASLIKADAIAALSPAPEGWRVVPVEPTEEMIEAALLCVVRENMGLEYAPSQVYRAMLSASPLPKPGTTDDRRKRTA